MIFGLNLAMAHPDEVGAGLPVAGASLWLRADKGIVGASPITEWVDQIAGVSFSAVGGPTFNATGFNGKPTVVLDGAGDSFTAAMDAGLSNTAGWTFLAALNHDNLGLDSLGIAHDGSTSNQLRLRADSSGGMTCRIAGSAVANVSSDATMLPAGTDSIISIRWDGSKVYFRARGADHGSPAATQSPGPMTTLTPGDALSTTEWDGDLSEFIIYPKDIGAAGVLAVEADMTARWGL